MRRINRLETQLRARGVYSETLQLLERFEPEIRAELLRQAVLLFGKL